MKQKMLKILASTVITVLLFVMPIFAVGAIVAVPVQAISEFFGDIGDFIFGDGETSADELVLLMQMSLQSKENQTKIKETYSGKLSRNGVDVPEHWLVVVQVLAGIEFEDVDQEMIDRLLDSAILGFYDEETKETTYELATVEIYADALMKLSPYNIKFEKISSSVLAEIITRVGNLDSGGSLSPELIEKYKGILMYPFSKKYPVGDSVGPYYPNGKEEMHNGLDLQAPCGTPTYAMDDGIVAIVETNNYWRGNYIIWSNGEVEYRYLHFRDPLTLKNGDTVKKGQYIGSVGNTGYSFGCHLHLEVRIDGEVIDPLDVLEVHNPILE